MTEREGWAEDGVELVRECREGGGREEGGHEGVFERCIVHNRSGEGVEWGFEVVRGFGVLRNVRRESG